MENRLDYDQIAHSYNRRYVDSDMGETGSALLELVRQLEVKTKQLEDIRKNIESNKIPNEQT